MMQTIGCWHRSLQTFYTRTGASLQWGMQAKAGLIRVVSAFPGVAGFRLNHAFTIRPAADFYIGSRDLGL